MFIIGLMIAFIFVLNEDYWGAINALVIGGIFDIVILVLCKFLKIGD